MKKRLIIMITAILIVLYSCVKNIDKYGFVDTTTLKGRVVEELNQIPISDVVVSVRNDNRTYISVLTNSQGEFEMNVDYTQIDDSYYLYLDGGVYRKNKIELKGLGLASYDYNSIVLSNIPTVITDTIYNITKNNATVIGVVVAGGGLTVTERGFCWSQLPNPTISDNSIKVGSGYGQYRYTLTNLESTKKYYVRTYAKNSNGIEYGNQLEFVTWPSFTYNGHIYNVAPGLVQPLSWSESYEYCDNLNLYGLTDWRMPNKDELVNMYINRETIGGFVTSYNNGLEHYWSSSIAYQGSHYVVNFDTGFGGGHGHVGYFSDEENRCLNVRPIRIDH
ncbi:MAG: DUF1566 domain-containing protein [Bacteroidales bacterium]|nr:DUF1566 domain-containing protein [Bacteroidales bacterium]